MLMALMFLVIPIARAEVNAAKQSRVLFVISKPTEIYTDLTKMVQDNLGGEQKYRYHFATETQNNFADSYQTFQPDLIVTVGAIAAETVMQLKPETPMIAVLITDSAFNILTKKYYASRVNAYASNVSVICLDQPTERSITLAKLLVPDANVVGVMTGPASILRKDEVSEYVTAAGMTPNVVNIKLKENPIHTLEPVIKSSDVFIPIPDNRLINIATAKWILQLSYRYKVPVIAYSKTYMDAGALAAIYSSVENVARQTTEFIISEGHNNKGGSYAAEYFSIRFNYSVASSLNIELQTEQFYRRELGADEG